MVRDIPVDNEVLVIKIWQYSILNMLIRVGCMRVHRGECACTVSAYECRQQDARSHDISV